MAPRCTSCWRGGIRSSPPTSFQRRREWLSDAPAPPSNWNPDVPAPLERLILDMLSKDRRRRPSASDVLQRLTAIGSPAPPGIPSTARGPRRMVGQDRAMAELLEAFREADAGRGVMVAISGEAGVGKTTLADAFTRLAEAREHLERGAAL